MTGVETTKIISENLKFTRLFMADVAYARPTQRFLTNEFYAFYQNWLFENSINKWNPKFDCDNFSMSYYTFAQICNRKSERLEEGIAVGVMFYKQDIGSAHAINFAIVEDKKFITIEPQTGQLLNLTEKEKASCWFAFL